MNDDVDKGTGSRKQRTRTVVITGGLGNLGTKLCRHLLSLNDKDATNDDDDNHHGEGSAQTKTNFSYKVILVEHPSFITAAASRTNATSTNSLLQDANVTLLPCNLGNPTPGQKHRLIEALTHADVCVHFSAVNPYPNATWDDCSQSLDHTYYIFTLAVQCAVRRVIFASSNHVMGGYKDDDHHQEKQYGKQGSLYPYTEPRVGTMPWNAHDIAHVRSGDGKAYGAAKLAGERYARTLGNLYGDVTTFVVLRVGWCQPGENIPATLTAAGSPPEYLLEEKNMDDDDDDDDDDDIVDDDGMKRGAAKEDVEQSKKNNNNLNNTTAAADDDDAANKDEIWYKQMWLSNRDFLAYFTAAMDVIVPTTAAAAATATSIATTSEQSGVVHQPQQQHNNNVQKGFLLLNAMSRNCNAKWNLDDTEKWLGVVSIDDSMA